MMPAGMPVSRIGLQVGARLPGRDQRGQVGKHAGVETGQQRREAGLGDVAGEQLVVRRRQRVPLVLLAERDQDLVDQRVAEPRHLPERPAVDVLAVVGVPQPDPLAARRGPHADGRVAAPGHRGNRHLDRDRVHVQVVGGVHPRRGAGEDVQPVLGVQVLERPQVAQVEDRAQVDVEALGALPGEHRDPVAQVVHRLAGQRGVVRRGQRPDVARRAGQPACRWSGPRSRTRRSRRRSGGGSRSGCSAASIGPVLYRKVFGLSTSVVKRNWKEMSAWLSPLLSTWISYRTSLPNS